MLTDTADNTQLGTTERIEMKERLVEEKFIQEIRRTVAENGTIDRKLANFMFVGPTGSGKSSLMARLLKRARKEISLSTGVCDPVVIVDVNFHSATAIDSDAWEEIDYDLSLLRQMNPENFVSSPPDRLVPKPSEEVNMLLPSELRTPGTKSRVRSALKSAKKYVSRHFTFSGRLRNVRTTASASQLSGTPIGITVLPVVKKHGGPKAFLNYLRRGVSLYLRDTGGQVEFQEMIALLVVGPSIFFFVFRIFRANSLSSLGQVRMSLPIATCLPSPLKKLCCSFYLVCMPWVHKAVPMSRPTSLWSSSSAHIRIILVQKLK